MKIFRKILMIVLALLPVLSLLLYAVGNVGNASGIDIPNMGELLISNNNDVYVLQYDSDTLSGILINPLVGSVESAPIQSLLAFCALLRDNCGMSVTYTLLALCFMLYAFAIEVAKMIFDIIVFIPRKCSELFRME